MYAIIKIAGKQFKVKKEQHLYAPKLPGAIGTTLTFADVLLLDDNGKVEVGTPIIKKAKVSGKILEHVKDDKVIVFKKKRRKGYKKTQGHRQDYTKVLIQDILNT